MVARAAVLALLLTALLAGCVVEDPGPSQAAVDGGSPPTGPDAGSSSTHRDPARNDGPVRIETTNGQVYAIQTVTITNDFGGADGAVVELTTRAGGIAVDSATGGGYRIVVTLKGYGDTEEIARSRLARLSVSHSDALGENLALDTEVHFPDESVGMTGGIAAYFPTAPAYRLDLDTSSGGIAVSDLSGPEIDAQTSSGGIAIDGAYDSIKARASSGGIALEARAGDVDALTGSGGVAAELEPLRTGTWRLEAGSGGVAVSLERGNAGYDVTADAGSGGVQVSVRGSDDVGSQSARHRHVRTSGFEDAGTQVTVLAETGSGGVAVADA